MTIGENMKVKWAMDFVVKLRKAELISADQGETARLLLERMRGVEVVACDQKRKPVTGSYPHLQRRRMDDA